MQGLPGPRNSPLRLSGLSLHSGRSTSVELSRIDGPSCIEADGCRAQLGSLSISRTDHGVCVALGALEQSAPRVDLIEHLAAALGGLWLLDGVLATIVGGEPPLLDGGAARFVEALETLGVSPVSARYEVTRDWSFDLGSTRYDLSPYTLSAPTEEIQNRQSFRPTQIDIEIDFAHPAIGAQHASWGGDAHDFATQIAPARTFGFLRDAEALRAASRATHVDTNAVVVLDDHGPIAGKFSSANEPARHKLLDLIGDLTLRGGPPQGRIHALRPGHAATHAMIDAALREGVLRSAPSLARTKRTEGDEVRSP